MSEDAEELERIGVESVEEERYISFLQKRIAKLEKENLMLRRALLRETAEIDRTYQDIKDKLEPLKATVLKAVINSIRVHQRPVNYEEIIRSFRSGFPFIRAKTETITRMVRRLREEGILFSPKQGFFYVNKEALKEVSKCL